MLCHRRRALRFIIIIVKNRKQHPRASSSKHPALAQPAAVDECVRVCDDVRTIVQGMMTDWLTELVSEGRVRMMMMVLWWLHFDGQGQGNNSEAVTSRL